MIAFNADGLAYEKKSKSVIPYEGDSLRYAYLSYRGPVFQWPEWAIRNVNTLLREGWSLEKALRTIGLQLTHEAS